MQRSPEGAFQPSDQELKYFARVLGANGDHELEHLLKGERSKLPRSWTVVTHAEDGALLYMNTDTGQVSWEHPRIVEISNLVRTVQQQHLRAADVEEVKRLIGTEEGIKADILGIRRQYDERQAALHADVQTSKYRAHRRFMQETRRAEAEIKEELEADFARRLKQIQAEANDYVRTEQERLDQATSGQRQKFHADFQVAQSAKHKVILDENGAKAFQQRKKEEVRYKLELKTLTETLQRRKLDVALVVADCEKHRAELQAQHQALVQSAHQQHSAKKQAKLERLVQRAEKYKEQTTTSEIKTLQAFVESFDARLSTVKQVLKREFDQEIAGEIDKLAKIYHTKADEVRQTAERRLTRELHRCSTESSELLKAQVTVLQDKCQDDFIRASASLGSQATLESLKLEVGSAKRKLSDAALLLDDRDNHLQQASSELKKLQDCAQEPPKMKHFGSPSVKNPLLMIRSPYSDRMSAPTSTKASTGRNVVFRSPYTFEEIDEDRSEAKTQREGSRRDVYASVSRGDPSVSKGDFYPSASVPSIRQSFSIYSRLLSRQVQSRIDLKTSLNKHSVWLDNVRDELAVAICGVRARRRHELHSVA
jgi:hypothetical protein